MDAGEGVVVLTSSIHFHGARRHRTGAHAACTGLLRNFGVEPAASYFFLSLKIEMESRRGLRKRRNTHIFHLYTRSWEAPN